MTRMLFIQVAQSGDIFQGELRFTAPAGAG
jgi:hypothetical protein